MDSEAELKQQLEELQKQLSKKLRFEDAISSIKSLLRDRYPSASLPLRKSFYSVVCRAATVLKTRHTAPGFWLAGLGLFQLAESLASEPSEKAHLRSCVSEAKEHLNQIEKDLPDVSAASSSRGGYLFEGHLTVDTEPPQPLWLQSETIMERLLAAESSRGAAEADTDGSAMLLEQLITNFNNVIPEMLDDDSKVPKVPPASKEVVANLPVITITHEILAKLGPGADCSICKENLVVEDKMQELPCQHTFHPPCLKPWLDEHNSCPICRHELPTDDHKYESWKEREREAEEERKGAANALRGGEFMYI
ncbi:unnamed protein product [Linum trigynum]|uniref:RING-type E3 ubiquitin transferase n=1 Tax=Linum trigynum TaxID=586398 RepID=A0AAV2D9J0_9ROSI